MVDSLEIEVILCLRAQFNLRWNQRLLKGAVLLSLSAPCPAAEGVHGRCSWCQVSGTSLLI